MLYAEEVHKKGAGKLNVHALIGVDGWLKVWATEENTKDAQTVAFMMSAQASPNGLSNLGGPPATQLIRSGFLLLWDRLGRAGRAHNPKACHYNPAIKLELFNRGVGCALLPPKGAEFNPIELFNGFIQRAVARWIPPGAPHDSYGHLVRGPRTKAECLQALHDTLEDLKQRPALFRHWYHRRALGSDAFKRWRHNAVAKKVAAARAAPGANPQVWQWQQAFAPTYVNIHAPGYVPGAPPAPAAAAGSAQAAGAG